ncbi:hypothetical protein Y1Q_0019062 [Alligator mississippiensis]|uniref:Uncharacterized protein n=1 Tax=Alligator mississippiensis TaxID=8496 RepID=A0A151N0T9_ALLMI|nr:hypothetical protein Y1Q_0019062 [Alligator mississippiensis]
MGMRSRNVVPHIPLPLNQSEQSGGHHLTIAVGTGSPLQSHTVRRALHSPACSCTRDGARLQDWGWGSPQLPRDFIHQLNQPARNPRGDHREDPEGARPAF